MEFFESAIKLVKSDEAIFAIVVVVVLLSVIKIFSKQTKKLNQKQSFSLYKLLWFGILVYLLILLVAMVYPLAKSKTNLSDSLKDINESNITIKAGEQNLDINNSMKHLKNSTISISD